MGVLPSFRGRGLGTALIAATLNDARRRGLVRVELTVFASNLPAIALYEKTGFTKEGVMSGAVLIDGRYEDAILMAIVSPT
jgi:RimJ/RimL family protein N-acetyltransferase